MDDSASAMPMINALRQDRWSAISSAPSTAAVSNTCAVPAPNTERRISFSRAGDNSSPITNSSMTTPISAAARMRSESWTTPKPSGPSSTPATR